VPTTTNPQARCTKKTSRKQSEPTSIKKKRFLAKKTKKRDQPNKENKTKPKQPDNKLTTNKINNYKTQQI